MVYFGNQNHANYSFSGPDVSKQWVFFVRGWGIAYPIDRKTKEHGHRNHLLGCTAHKQTTPIQLQHLSVVTVLSVRRGSAVLQNTRCGHELRRHPRQLPHPNVEVLHDALRFLLQQTPTVAGLQLPPKVPRTFSFQFGFLLPGETCEFIFLPERVSLMLSVSSNCSARSRNDGSFRKRSPSSNHFCAEDNRPCLVHDKPPCFSNRRLRVSSNQCGVGCVRLAGGGFGGTNTPEDAIASNAGEYRSTTPDC